MSEKDKEIIELNSKVANFTNEKEIVKKDAEKDALDKISQREKEITELNLKIQTLDSERKIELIEVSSAQEKRITEL